MPFTLEGWIEVARSPETADEHAWFGAVDLGAIVDVADEDTERLFGLSKACVSGEKAVDSLAAGRGLPPNPSAQARRALDEIAKHEAQFGSGEFGGYTHAMWAEIRHYALAMPLKDSQWALPFELARILETRFGSDRIRVILWYNW
jgi:hypothetical protein